MFDCPVCLISITAAQSFIKGGRIYYPSQVLGFIFFHFIIVEIHHTWHILQILLPQIFSLSVHLATYCSTSSKTTWNQWFYTYILNCPCISLNISKLQHIRFKKLCILFYNNCNLEWKMKPCPCYIRFCQLILPFLKGVTGLPSLISLQTIKHGLLNTALLERLSCTFISPLSPYKTISEINELCRPHEINLVLWCSWTHAKRPFLCCTQVIKCSLSEGI